MDKLLHFAAGLAISLTVSFGTGEPVYGLTAGCVAGVGKEAFDSTQRGNRFDEMDMLATFGGALVGYGISELVDKEIHSENR